MGKQVATKEHDEILVKQLERVLAENESLKAKLAAAQKRIKQLTKECEALAEAKEDLERNRREVKQVIDKWGKILFKEK